MSLKTSLRWSLSTPPGLDRSFPSVQLPADACPAPLSWEPTSVRLFLQLRGCSGLPGVPALCSHPRCPNPYHTHSMAYSRQIARSISKWKHSLCFKILWRQSWNSMLGTLLPHWAEQMQNTVEIPDFNIFSLSQMYFFLFWGLFPLSLHPSQCPCLAFSHISLQCLSQLYFLFFPTKFHIIACRPMKQHLHLNYGTLHILLPAVWKHKCPCPLTEVTENSSMFILWRSDPL